MKLSELVKRFEGDDPELAIQDYHAVRPVLTVCGHLDGDGNRYVVLLANNREEVQ